MVGVKTASLAAAATLLSTATFAADVALPPPVYQPIAVEASGWYLRGYIGMSNQFVSSISHPAFESAAQFTLVDSGGFTSAPFVGAGIGYQWNNWLRFDTTVEYRGASDFHALDRFFNPLTRGFNTNQFTATKSEVVALLNGYLDLGTWWCVTPFVGAGIGVSYIQVSHFREENAVVGGSGFADTGTQTNFAWALHAGATYKVTSNFGIELSYRYLNMGNAHTGLVVNLDPALFGGVLPAPVSFHNLQSHDIMLSMRWLLQQPEPVYPLMRKG
jgi:opacity protein-like surface antigen